MSKIVLNPQYEKPSWPEVLKLAATEQKNTGNVLQDLPSLRLSQLPMGTKLKDAVEAALKEFVSDPSQYIAGGNVNAFQIYQMLYRSSITFNVLRDFCIFYIARGKNFSKMLDKTSRQTPSYKKLNGVMKQLNIKSKLNLSGYQPEAIAGALSPFMQIVRQYLGMNRMIPEIDLEAENSIDLTHPYRWVGSLISVPIIGDVDQDAEWITNYDKFVQDYISRRSRGVQLSSQQASKNTERLRINRSFYATVMSIYSDDVKAAWSKGIWQVASPGSKKSEAYYLGVSKKVGFDMYRPEDVKKI